MTDGTPESECDSTAGGGAAETGADASAEAGTDASAESGAGAPDVRIRQIERADLLDVLGIERRCFDEPWPYTAFESLLSEPGFLVAVRDGGVVGYVVADVMPNHGRDIGHVKDLAVAPEARGAGLGRHLLERGLVSVAMAGATVVKLEVRVDNDPALSLYRDVGFEPARRIQSYYADGEDALLMVLDVDAWRDGSQ